MNTNNKNIKSVRFIEKSNSLLLKTDSGETFFVNVNLVKHELEIPYTKKNQEFVSVEQIIASKTKAQIAYVKRIQENKQKASA